MVANPQDCFAEPTPTHRTSGNADALRSTCRRSLPIPVKNKHAPLQARLPTVAFSILLVARLPAAARLGLAPATRSRRKGISRRGLRRVRRKDQVSYSRSHYHATFNLADNTLCCAGTEPTWAVFLMVHPAMQRRGRPPRDRGADCALTRAVASLPAQPWPHITSQRQATARLGRDAWPSRCRSHPGSEFPFDCGFQARLHAGRQEQRDRSLD